MLFTALQYSCYNDSARILSRLVVDRNYHLFLVSRRSKMNQKEPLVTLILHLSSVSLALNIGPHSLPLFLCDGLGSRLVWVLSTTIVSFWIDLRGQ
jgi:hypothetical protein